jgi:hypothetical protein
MGARRNREEAGGLYSLELIPGLLKSLKMSWVLCRYDADVVERLIANSILYAAFVRFLLFGLLSAHKKYTLLTGEVINNYMLLNSFYNLKASGVLEVILC